MEASQHSIDSTDSFAYTDMPIPSISLPDDNVNLGLYNDRNSKSDAEILLEQQEHQLSALFAANETLKKDTEKLKPAGSRDISGKGGTAQKLDDLLGSFIDGAGLVLDELTVLGTAHPILAVVIFAFKEVVSLDIARRDNNKKVVVVVLQMQSMLGPMLQLRNLSRSHMAQTKKQFYEDRLAKAVEYIRKDIDKCRSDIMYFMDRKFLNKLLLSKGYEKTFANHMEKFSKRRAELQTIISEYIAISVNEIAEKVNIMDVKLDKIIEVLFRNLDTPREKEVLKFIDDHGGPEKCVNDRDLLPKLVSKAGESTKTGKVNSEQAELEDLRKSLTEALSEDLDKVLEKQYSRFEKALEVQSKSLQRISSNLEDQGPRLGKILETVTTIRVLEEGKYKMKEVRFGDPEIQDIWTRMNLGRSSVKAKVFVLTFRDYIRSGNSAIGSPALGSVALPQGEGETSTVQPSTSNTDDSEWVLEYIDAAYVQPIIEAIDEDGSGFISVKEANSFSLSRDRPKDMKLLSWIAYWAAGWHINLVKYQKDIYSILLQMHKSLPSIHIANRAYVDDFLDETVMRRVEALCRSLKPLPNTHRKDPKLLAVANEVASWQLKRLKTNLNDMGFVIESPFYAVTISESARVETWIFPLLYLLLQRYLEVINVAKTVVLDSSEFESHVASLSSVFWVFDERMESLEAKFRQLHKDVDAQFHSFSYGMFYAAYKKNELDTWLNTLLTRKTDKYIDQKDTSINEKQAPNTSVLSKPPGEALELIELNLLPSSAPPPEHVAHPIEGEWFGWFDRNGRQNADPYRCVIHPIINNRLVGKGVTYFATIDFVGTIDPDAELNKTRVKFAFIPELPEEGWSWRLVCEGFYDPVRDTIEGVVLIEVGNEEPMPVIDEQAVTVPSTSELGADVSEIYKAESNEAHEAKRSEGTVESEKIGENKLPKSPAEKWTPDEELINNEGTAVVETPTKNGHTQSPTPNSPVTSDVTIEDASITPPQTSTDVNQPSGSTEKIVDEPLNGVTPRLSIDSPASPITGGEGESTQFETTEKATGNETERFYLTRTPPHLFRFRHLLDGPGPAPCWGAWPIWRKRWAFATEAVLHETRLRMWSKKAIGEALAERRRWLYYSIKYDTTDPKITPGWYRFDWFMQEDWEAILELTSLVRPDVVYTWEKMAHFMARRQTYSVGPLVCDLCNKWIMFCRYQCIVCVEDDLRSGIDLCQKCFDMPEGAFRGMSDDFVHLASHTLLRSQKRLHSCELNNLIPAARLHSEQCKTRFRELENTKSSETMTTMRKVVEGKRSRKPVPENLPEHGRSEPPSCSCCDKKVTLPCWVCFECSPLAFVCMSCDRKKARINRDEHSVLEHHLLLIHDSVEVKSGKGLNVERQLEDIHKSISTLDGKVNQLDDINESIFTLEEKVQRQFQEVKHVVKDMAKTIGIEWNEGAVLSAEASTPRMGPKDMELGAEELVVPVSAEDFNGEEGNTDALQANSTLGYGKAYVAVNENGGEKSEIGGGDKVQPSRNDRLAALEANVRNINQTLREIVQDNQPGVLGNKLDALEAKMDRQFGAVLALMQNFIAGPDQMNATLNDSMN